MPKRAAPNGDAFGDLVTEVRKNVVAVSATLLTGTVGIFQWFLPRAFGALSETPEYFPLAVRIFALAYATIPLVGLAAFLAPRRANLWRLAGGSMIWIGFCAMALMPSFLGRPLGTDLFASANSKFLLPLLLSLGPIAVLLFAIGLGGVRRWWTRMKPGARATSQTSGSQNTLSAERIAALRARAPTTPCDTTPSCNRQPRAGGHRVDCVVFLAVNFIQRNCRDLRLSAFKRYDRILQVQATSAR